MLNLKTGFVAFVMPNGGPRDIYVFVFVLVSFPQYYSLVGGDGI